jgi:hypothetical protein
MYAVIGFELGDVHSVTTCEGQSQAFREAYQLAKSLGIDEDGASPLENRTHKVVIKEIDEN